MSDPFSPFPDYKDLTQEQRKHLMDYIKMIDEFLVPSVQGI